MGIPLRTEEEIVKLREACKLASDVLVMIEPYVKEGVTTGELDRICHDYMVNVQKVIPACLNYHGFPKATCISINEVVCHGIPSDDKKLKRGDIVNHLRNIRCNPVDHICSPFNQRTDHKSNRIPDFIRQFGEKLYD